MLLLKPGRKKNQELLQKPLSVISIRFESNFFPPCTFGDPFVNSYQINVKVKKNTGWRVDVPFGKHLLVFWFVLLIYEKIDRNVMCCLVFCSYWRILVRGWYRVIFQRQFLQNNLQCLLMRGNFKIRINESDTLFMWRLIKAPFLICCVNLISVSQLSG